MLLAIRERAVAPWHAERSAPSEEPGTDPDSITTLGDRIATLSAHIHAATYELLKLIAEFDRKRGWEMDGQLSCAHWLAFRTGIDAGAAREKVRAARALEQLPQISAAMSRGELSFSQVRALSRVARPDTESDLLAFARGATAAQLERMIRAWRRSSRTDEAEADRKRRDSRSLSVFCGDDGMYEIRGRLAPEVGALLMRALEAAGDALYNSGDNVVGDDTGVAAAHRRADAIGLIAERAMDAGFAMNHVGGPPVSGTRARRYQVILHVDASSLAADGEPGRAELEDGTRVSAETCRKLTCDGSVVRVATDPHGTPLDVGRRTRTIPPALRRALDARDRGCRFPGCGLRFTDAHHVRHWADGGKTSLSNCLLLCSRHHTLVHEGGWTVQWWGEGRPVFIDPRGQSHFDGSWQPPKLAPRPARVLVQNNVRRGTEPNAHTAGARWKRESDIPPEVCFRASEAL